MTDEHKTGQRVSDGQFVAWAHLRIFEIDCLSEDDRVRLIDLAFKGAEVARLTEQLAAKDAEIERWKATAAKAATEALDNGTRAERAEADLKAARTVDDEKVERAKEALLGLPGSSLGGARGIRFGSAIADNLARAALTAALSLGQVGEETKKLPDAMSEADWQELLASCPPPQPRDQPSGGDESDAAWKDFKSSHGYANAVRYEGMVADAFRSGFTAARRASQPSDAVAAVERLRNEAICRRDELLAHLTCGERWNYWSGAATELTEAINVLRTLPSAPEPAQPVATWCYDMDAAPRDGTIVIGTDAFATFGMSFNDRSDDYRTGYEPDITNGYWSRCVHEDSAPCEPIAWMPLPAPPSPKSSR